MEYAVRLDPATADAARDALLDRDPASLVDVDPREPGLRIATCLDHDGLRGALLDAGLRIAGADIVVQPSVCCGGCGG